MLTISLRRASSILPLKFGFFFMQRRRGRKEHKEKTFGELCAFG
jgi:hypothetical protein